MKYFSTDYPFLERSSGIPLIVFRIKCSSTAVVSNLTQQLKKLQEILMAHLCHSSIEGGEELKACLDVKFYPTESGDLCVAINF